MTDPISTAKKNGWITLMILVYNFMVLEYLMPQLVYPYLYWGTICLNAFATYLILYNAGVDAGRIRSASGKPENEKTIRDKLDDNRISLWEVTRIVPWVFCELGINLFYILVLTTILIGIILKEGLQMS